MQGCTMDMVMAKPTYQAQRQAPTKLVVKISLNPLITADKFFPLKDDLNSGHQKDYNNNKIASSFHK